MRRKTERQGTEAERQLAWSREYLRREKRRRVLRRTLLMLVLALACAVTVFALNGGIHCGWVALLPPVRLRRSPRPRRPYRRSPRHLRRSRSRWHIPSPSTAAAEAPWRRCKM